ncbi:hypothetical protein ACF0H5_016804 [Mactra antiquata]
MLQSSYFIVTILTVWTITIDISVSENNGNNGGCFYKGEYYTGNWTDGCDFNCTCINSETGHYKCTTRCPTFREIPSGCVLALPPGEECCKQPDCRTLTSYHSNTNDADNSDKNTTTTDGNSHVENTTDNDTVKGCYYKGQYYPANWTDGCQIVCHCQDPVAGVYNCIDRCKEQYDTSKGCETKSTGNDDCCPDPSCNATENRGNDDHPSAESKHENVKDPMPTTDKATKSNDNVQYKTALPKGNTTSPSIAKDTHRLAAIFSQFGPVNLFPVKTRLNDKTNKNESKQVLKQQKLRPGLDYIPTSTENKKLVSQPLAFGLGINYTQDERWYDGCQYMCACLNAKHGEYQCINRCQQYNGLPVGCIMKRSKSDNCCFEPDCRYGSVVRREYVHDAHWVTSSLLRLKFPQNAKLRQMFNKRMELKKSVIREKQPVNYSLMPNTKVPQDVNEKGKVTQTTIQLPENPTSRFAGNIEPIKRPVRFSDVSANVKTVQGNQNKRFTDYISPTSIEKPDAKSNNTMSGGLHSVDRKESAEVDTRNKYHTPERKTIPLDIVLVGVDNRTNPYLEEHIEKQYVVKYNNTGNKMVKGFKRNAGDTNDGLILDMVRQNDITSQNATTVESTSYLTSADNSNAYVSYQDTNNNSSSVHILTIDDSTIATNGSYAKPSDPKTLQVDVNSSNVFVSNSDKGSNDFVTINNSINSTDNLLPKPYVTETKVQDSKVTYILNEFGQEKSNSENRSNIQIGNPNSVSFRKLIHSTQGGVKHITESTIDTQPLYRTIKTNTGVFKVSVKDGVMVPVRQPLLGVLGKMLQSISRRQTKKEVTITKGKCEYKGKLYKRGELWFDKCDYVCKCDSYGRHTCQQRCPQHEYIPKGCIMLKPTSAACCDILVCKNTTTEKHIRSYTQDNQVG